MASYCSAVLKNVIELVGSENNIITSAVKIDYQDVIFCSVECEPAEE